jgi:WD40 repeat protein
MTQPDTRPVALLIYSTAGDSLPALQAEVDGIAAHLSNTFEVKQIPSATLDDLLKCTGDKNFREQIVVIHYAGHANGEGVLLARGGGPHDQFAHAEGLAEVFKRLTQLRWVFINGCSSREQVLEYLKCGIPVVIATSEGIDDETARQFAVRLYQGLAQGQELFLSFEFAQGAIKSSVGSTSRPAYWGKFRESEAARKNEWPWQLYGSSQDRKWTILAPFSSVETRWDHSKFALNQKSPYVGVQRFEEGDEKRFFGRTDLIEKLLSCSDTAPLLMVFGASGSGKSSVVRAGMIPAWKRKHGPASRVFILEPQTDPFREFGAQLRNVPSFDRTKIDQAEVPSKAALTSAVSGLNKGEPWLIFIDQFEQIFTRTEDPFKRDQFLSAVAQLAINKPQQVCLVLAMRDDFFPNLRGYPDLFPLTDANAHRVAALSLDALEEAIIRPAAEHGVAFEPGLVSEIIETVYGRPGALPLLQYGLSKLWDHDGVSDRKLNWSSYTAIGGVTGSLRQRLQELFDQQDEASQKQFRFMMLKFLTFVDGESGAKPVSREAQKSEFSNLQINLLEPMLTEGLVVSSASTRPSFQLGHEAIIEAWQTFNTWTVEIQEAHRLHQQLSTAASSWVVQRRITKALWQGALLERAVELRDNGAFDNLGGLSPVETEFLKASQDESQKMIRRLRAALVGVGILLIAAIGFGGLSYLGYHNADTKSKEAQHNLAANDLSHAAFAIREGRTFDALHWYVRAIEHAPDGDWALQSAQNLLGTWSQQLKVLLCHDGAVIAVAFSPDGQTVITGSGDTARLWDATTGQPLGEPLKHEKSVNVVAFNSDGLTVLTGSEDGTERLWDAKSGQPRGEPLKHEGRVIAVAFSPDGLTVLTGINSDTARLWDAATGQPRGEPLKHDHAVTAVAFSPNGQTVITGGADGRARLWDATTGQPLGEHVKHFGKVHAVAFSPDGQTVITGGGDWKARLWDAKTGRPRGEPLKHQGEIYAVAFSLDGKTVLTGSKDTTARLWDAKSGQPRGEPLNHQQEVNTVAISPDGQTVITGGAEGNARLWDATTGQLRGGLFKHQGTISALAFSPDGQSVLTGSADGTARLWDAKTGRPRGEPLKYEGRVLAVAFSPDGLTVITGSKDGTERLWDAKTGQPRGEPLKHQGQVLAVAFSPDAQTVLTGIESNIARLWDAATGEPRGAPIKHQSTVTAVAFSLDGQIFLTGSFDGATRLWDAKTGQPRGEPLKHKGNVLAVAFSRDGLTVLTGSDDFTARLWDTKTGQPRGEPLKHQGEVTAVAFSPDGQTVLTGSGDKKARLWDAKTGQPRGEPLIHENLVCAVAFSRDGETALTGSLDGTARLWDAKTGDPRGEPFKHDGQVLAMAFSPVEQTVLTGSEDGTARLWDAMTVQPRGEPLNHEGEVHAVAFSPDGQSVITGGVDGKARMWDTKLGQPRGAPLKHEGRVIAVAFSTDGLTVLTGSADGTARLWDAKTGQPHGEPLKYEGRGLAAAFSLDGLTVLTENGDGTARLWDAKSGKPRGEPLKHEGQVLAVAFSPDGLTVLTGSADGTARLWDAKTGQPHGEPLKHDEGQVLAVAFSPDGLTVLTGSLFGTAKLWDRKTGRPQGEPLKHEGDVPAVAFSPDGQAVLTGANDSRVLLWSVAPPSAGKSRLEQLRLSVEVRTRTRFDENSNTIVRLSQKEWLERQTRLWELGGPCDARTWDQLDEAEKKQHRRPSFR